MFGGIPSDHCRCQVEHGPNSGGLDGLFNYLALNLVNTITNPNADLYPAWTDRKGYEAGHKCVSQILFLVFKFNGKRLTRFLEPILW